MQERLRQLRSAAEADFARAAGLDAIEELRVKYFGRRAGLLTLLTKAMSECAPEERPVVGRLLNELKEEIQAMLDRRRDEIESLQRPSRTEPGLDLSFPGTRPRVGRRHPLSSTLDDICAVFLNMGFQIRRGPEIESDHHNFEALNIPKEHPARDMQDTFYISDEWLLRTHTSPVQIRTMLQEQPPIQMIAPGKVYRKDSDITHSPVFHQVEGLMVDRGIHMGHLKAVLQAFVEELFGRGTSLRFRPSYFPFTEPSAEVDIQCVICKGAGCRVCGRSGWLEILGAGMVHPQVFVNVGYDPTRVTGFAFGMGVERIAMLRHGVGNIRLFYENDLRFLEQF